jgi:hypothetical protein
MKATSNPQSSLILTSTDEFKTTKVLDLVISSTVGSGEILLLSTYIRAWNTNHLKDIDRCGTNTASGTTTIKNLIDYQKSLLVLTNGGLLVANATNTVRPEESGLLRAPDINPPRAHSLLHGIIFSLNALAP